MKPIINSLLDLDYYKITMANMIFEKGHSDVHVKYAFTNRSKDIDLKNWININELENQINHIRGLKISDNELKWLWGKGPFSFEFIEALKGIELPKPKILIHDGNFAGIEIEGRWFDAIWWETYLLSIINQMFSSQHMKHFAASYDLFDNDMMPKGVSNLENKMQELLKYSGVNFMEFGTRRRFSTEWQDYVIRRLKQEINGQLLGTSNVHYAMKYGLKPLGTQAHELWMAYAALFDGDIVNAQIQLLDDWWDVYGGAGSIALTDTWGTDFFLSNFPLKHMINYWGIRQDSGDPFIIGDKVVEYYKQNGIDPSGKMIVFSDGLTLDKIINLYNYFSPKISVGFGWGTNLTNDLGGKPLSIVIKLVEANGRRTCKLSDNVEKAIGDKDVVAKYKLSAGYTNTFQDETVY